MQFTAEFFKMMECSCNIQIVFPPHLLSSITAASDKIVVKLLIYNDEKCNCFTCHFLSKLCLQICSAKFRSHIQPKFQQQLHAVQFCVFLFHYYTDYSSEIKCLYFIAYINKHVFEVPWSVQVCDSTWVSGVCLYFCQNLLFVRQHGWNKTGENTNYVLSDLKSFCSVCPLSPSQGARELVYFQILHGRNASKCHCWLAFNDQQPLPQLDKYWRKCRVPAWPHYICSRYF